MGPQEHVLPQKGATSRQPKDAVLALRDARGRCPRKGGRWPAGQIRPVACLDLVAEPGQHPGRPSSRAGPRPRTASLRGCACRSRSGPRRRGACRPRQPRWRLRPRRLLHPRRRAVGLALVRQPRRRLPHHLRQLRVVRALRRQHVRPRADESPGTRSSSRPRASCSRWRGPT